MADNKALIVLGGLAAGAAALFAFTRKPKEERPGDIILSDLVITPLTVMVGEAVTISVLATNIGAERATKTVRMEVR